MRILILGHERSVNKAQAIINHWDQTGRVVLVTDIPVSAFKTFAAGVENVVVPNFDICKILTRVPSCSQIICVSENLLPIQAELELHYKIENLNLEAAKILSNKRRFQEFCGQIGLAEFSPKSIVPERREDFDIFQGPVILKPDIGTGANLFLEGDLKNLEYRAWPSGKELLSTLESKGSVEKVLNLNSQGIRKKRFNDVPCRMILQEFKVSEAPPISPCGFVRDGAVNILFYIKNIKVAEESFPAKIPHNLEELHFPDVPKGKFGDFGIYSCGVDKVDRSIHEKIEKYLETIVSNLNVKNLFFAGPDFHLGKDGLSAIDFNPRIGHFFNLLDMANDGVLVKSYYEMKPLGDLKNLLWASLSVPFDHLPVVPWVEKFKDVLCLESLSSPAGAALPRLPYLQSKPRSLQVQVVGESPEALFKNYHRVQVEITNTLYSGVGF